jgi:hypothetical protein
VELAKSTGKSERSLYEISKKFNWKLRCEKADSILKQDLISEKIEKFKSLQRERLDRDLKLYQRLMSTMNEFAEKPKKPTEDESRDEYNARVDRELIIFMRYLKIIEMLEKELTKGLGISHKSENQIQKFEKNMKYLA